MRRLRFYLPVLTATQMALFNPALAQTGSDAERYGYGPRMMWDGGWPMMFFGPLFMIVVVAAIVVAVVFLLRGLDVTTTPGVPSLLPANRALDILKERFARGEIDKTEFEERRRILGE